MTAAKTATKTATKTAAPKKATKAIPRDAIALLKADHEEVDELFAEFEKARSAPKKQAIVAEICAMLTVHTQIEEEIFYPAFKEALKDDELIPEALVEHAGVRDLIAQLESGSPEDEMYDAKVKVLSEYVKHHVEEEHTEMFPKAKASKLDLVELGDLMAARKADLMAQAA